MLPFRSASIVSVMYSMTWSNLQKHFVNGSAISFHWVWKISRCVVSMALKCLSKVWMACAFQPMVSQSVCQAYPSFSKVRNYKLSPLMSFQINRDLKAEVQFVSAAGSFSVPIRCTIKKCNVSTKNDLVWRVPIYLGILLCSLAWCHLHISLNGSKRPSRLRFRMYSITLSML